LYKFDAPQVRRFDSLASFFQTISDGLVTRNHDYGFRGHTCSSWTLETTLMRYIKQTNSTWNMLKADMSSSAQKVVARRLRSNLKKNLIVNRDFPQEFVENTDLWQLGQHFGLPSPLLDWSYSPYVALFFALNSPSTSEAARCVWKINLEMLEHLNREIQEHIYPKKSESLSESLLEDQFPKAPIIGDENAFNQRIAFQQGFFIKVQYYENLETWLKRITPELAQDSADRPTLEKFEFYCSESERLEYLDILDKMNINYRTLFPDVFGSVQDAIDSTTRSFTAPSTRSYSFGKSEESLLRKN